jgi:hypothetical protein
MSLIAGLYNNGLKEIQVDSDGNLKVAAGVIVAANSGVLANAITADAVAPALAGGVSILNCARVLVDVVITDADTDCTFTLIPLVMNIGGTAWLRLPGVPISSAGDGKLIPLSFSGDEIAGRSRFAVAVEDWTEDAAVTITAVGV